MSRMCACCRGWRGSPDAEGESALYSPGRAFTLCDPCWEDEDRLIDASGTNDHPVIVAMYARRERALEAMRGETEKAA
jgi:hypothetical protein